MNKTLGFIPLTEDRNIFDMRRSFIQSLHPLGKLIVEEYEKFFIGNNYSGYKFHKILSQLIDDYELWLKSPRNYSLDYWFDYTSVSQVYQWRFYPFFHSYYKTSLDKIRISDIDSEPTPYNFNRLINADGRYLGLSRNDGKLAPISLVLNFSDTYFYTVKMPLTFKALRNGVEDGVYSHNGFQKDSDKIAHYVTMGILKDFIINAAPVTPTNLSSKYNCTFGINLTDISYPDGFTPLQFLQIMRDTIDAIKFLEDYEVAINFKGNTDGLKINEYEQILSDQLNYLNNLSDKVQNSLIAEKLSGQELKDSLTKAISERQAFLNEQIAQKRENIKKMRGKVQEFSMIYQLT